MLKAQITKSRRGLTVHAELELRSGEALALFGASGAGKSTVLACIAGIEDPDQGSVQLNGMRLFPPHLPLHQRALGYLTQDPGLFPHLTVGENVLFGVHDRAASPQETEWVETLKQRLQLAPFWNANAARISGGQARRVGLARMLARRPPLVLLDEPFAGLDRQSVRELIDDLNFWRRSEGFSLIAVDHQAEVLERLCPEQVMVMEAGRVVQQGSWEDLVNSPATPLLRSLLAPL